MKLSYKLFTAFSFTCLILVGLMIGTMQFFAYRNFSDYINNLEMETLSDLVDNLALEYQKNNGWDALKANPERWREIRRSSISKTRASLDPSVRPPGPHNNIRPRPPVPPGNFSDFRGPPPKKILPGLQPEGHRPPPAPPRFSLFDAQKQYVVGHDTSPLEHTLREISLKGNTIGWLGLKKKENISHPLDIDYLKQQTKGFYLIGCAILLLAAIISFFLSKHLLSPIKQLIAGTQAVASRKFDTRIDVFTGDELGQLAANFNEMANTLEKFELMRRQWISDISHELRTPLSILRGEIEAMQDGVRDMSKKSLDSLHSEILHVNHIINDLHELSLADTGVLHFKNDRVNPLRVIRKVITQFQTRLEKSHISVVDEMGPEKDMIITGDKDRLTQLFSNLFENALHHMDTPGTLRIWQSRTENQLMLFVEDSGPGVPDHALERLFDRLYRVDPSRNRNKGGSGLGLSICKYIVENHEGTIKAENASSGGLLIQITFPLTQS